MVFDINTILFVGFLIINVWFGLTSGRGVNTLKVYAIGNKKFSTETITATLVATWVCGEFFYTITIETYKEGLYFIIAALGNIVSFLLIAYFFVPRMAKFIGTISIAEAMNNLYGKRTRICTAIAGFICTSGIIAVQLKIAGNIFEHLLNLPSLYGILLSGLIITLYSTFGGIKSVTFTDQIQFFTFGITITFFTYLLYQKLGGIEKIIYQTTTDPNYDLDNIFNYQNKKSWYYLFLTFYMMIPAFNPAIFQRISMSKDIFQCQKAFSSMAFWVLVFTLTIVWLGIVLKSYDPNLDTTKLLNFILDESPKEYKGLLLIGVTAMVMSTADSYVNSSSVLITHDFINVFKKLKNELLSARIVSALLGLSGIFLALKDIGLFQLILLSSSFYMVTVTVPFIMAICDYKTPFENAVLWGMGAGFITVLAWYYYEITTIDGIIPGMLANLIVLILMHYYYSYLQKRSKLKS